MEPKRIPHLQSPEELLENAFRRASRRSGRQKSGRKAEEEKVREASRYIDSQLKKAEELRELIASAPPFYQELIDVKAGRERVEKAIDTVSWARALLKRLARKMRLEMRGRRSAEDVRREFYGRAASIVRRIGASLELLSSLTVEMRSFPTIKECYTVVIAGMPNVGKSSLLRCLSPSKPEVKPYPFTTRSILIGYLEWKPGRKVQLIDTPGLLDRPLEERGRVERQAVLALKHLSNLTLYIFDPSETCGYPLDSQLQLYRELESTFGRARAVANKCDLAGEEKVRALEAQLKEKLVRCSAKHCAVEEVRRLITSSHRKKGTQAPL